jgi:CubicO group peptidase (beta-lactamase class C family)
MKVSSILGSIFSQNGKENVTVLNCLLHNAGFPPDPNPNYWEQSFGCPESNKLHPQENFSCRKQIYQGLMAQYLVRPVGLNYTYSDLSFLTLGYVVGRMAKSLGYVKISDLIPGCYTASPDADLCFYEAYVRKYVFTALQMVNTGFLPPKEQWGQCAPCINDTWYRHRTVQGQVSDENTYALGGIAGHAGLFSNAADLAILMRRIMFASDSDSFLNRTTVDLFTTEYNNSQSSRALGWNTNDPTAYDYGWGLECGHKMDAKTWMHTGFTGTELCGDPTRQLITILLTNRVYPSPANTKIQQVRRLFNDAVVDAWDEFLQHRKFQ